MLESVKNLLDKRGTGGIFSSLSILPQRVSFESQDPHEKVILLLRPHLVTNWWWIAIALVMLPVPLVWGSLPVISLLPANYLLVISLFWYALVLVFLFENFLDWFFSVNIVTDERIIDVDFYGLLFKTVDVANINKIQDVNYVQKGILSAFFNYGSVLIQTASEIPEFSFENVPHPEDVMKVISELISQEEQESLEGRVR